jgi:outer membrane protein TolC
MLKRILLLFAITFIFQGLSAQKQSLDYYIDRAIRNSPLLRDYQNQLSSSAVDSMLIRASQKFQTDVTSTISYAPVISDWGYDEALTNGVNIIGQFGVKQEIMNKSVLDTKFKGINIKKQSVTNSIKISISDLKKSITTQYLTTYGDFNDIEFTRGQLKIINDQLELLKHLVQNGVYKQSDYLSLLAEAQAQETALIQFISQYSTDLQSLNQLCGINDNKDVELAIPVISELKIENFNLSPLFMQFKIDSTRIENEKQLIADQVKPKLNWYADAGIMSSTITNIYKHFGVNAGINLTIPIYDGGQRKLEIQKLTLTQNTRSSYQNYFKSQYQQHVFQIYNDLSNLTRVVDQVKKQLATSKELIDVIRRQLSNGAIPVIEFLNALRNYSVINRMINQSEIKRLVLINELNYLKQQ